MTRYRCNIDGSEFSSYAALMQHMEVHGDDNWEEIEGGYRCNIDGSEFSSYWALLQHMEVHDGDDWEEIED